MCGIVGIFLKDPKLEPELGQMLSSMLCVMTDRGPDSAGFAIYGNGAADHVKLSLRAVEGYDFEGLAHSLSVVVGGDPRLVVRASHAVIEVPADQEAAVRTALAARHPEVAIVGTGARMEIFKEIGLPSEVAERFDLPKMSGTHGIGHTRMATESSVTTDGAHPFSTADDQCLVHNGSLSNHNQMRRKLARQGVHTTSENDTEVGAAYISARIAGGDSLGEALEGTLRDLDGFFTFVTGTRNGFGVVRDPIACKPAVMAETDDYVAFASEYRAFVDLPGIEGARVWEPEPATVYFWER
jgi:methylamine---glutamate N-methyltransferase subunit A